MHHKPLRWASCRGGENRNLRATTGEGELAAKESHRLQDAVGVADQDADA